MSVWGRARDGRLTAIVGAPPPAPVDLSVVRCRCGSGLSGVLRLSERLGLASDGLITRLRRPLADRLLDGLAPREPADELLRALRAERGRRVVVISQVERAGSELEPVLGALITAGDVPVLLVANESTPLLESVRERHGNAALIELGAPQTPLGGLPTDVLQVLVAAAAHQGPIALETLALLCHRPAHEVLASLQGAVVRGIPIEDDGEAVFTVDPDIVDELRSITLPTWARKLASEDSGQRPTSEPDLAIARSAVALGVWPAARRLFARAGHEGRLEHAALAWAMGDGPGARSLILEDDPPDLPALLGVLWDLEAFDDAAEWVRELPGIRGSIDALAIEMRRGASEAARHRLEALLPVATGAERAILLHLAGILALREDRGLDSALAGVTEVLQSEDDPGRRGRLLETQARLSLRLDDPSSARGAFLLALPLLAETGQVVATARATAGLARASDLDTDAGEVLSWLDRVVRANRNRAEGLVWCRATLQSLMEQVPVSGRTTSLTDLRRVSLELAALVAQYRQLPTVEAL